MNFDVVINVGYRFIGMGCIVWDNYGNMVVMVDGMGWSMDGVGGS